MCILSGPDYGNAYAEQEQRERERQAQIEKAIKVVNSSFDDPSRSDVYNDVYQSVYDRNVADLNEDYQDAIRQAKFASARSGQAGGSAGADRYKELEKRYDDALLDAEALAEQAKQGFVTMDNNSRNSLINLVYGGLDSQTALQRALSDQQTTLARANADARTLSLGDVFSDFANSYQTGQVIAGRNSARNAFDDDQFNTYFSNAGKEYRGG